MVRNLLFDTAKNKWYKTMQVRSPKSNAILDMKNLRDLAAPSPMFMIKPDNGLRELSMLINPKPYINRALRITALKQDSRSQVMLKQKLICAMCEKPILDFNNLSNLSRLNERISLIDAVGSSSTESSEITTSLLVKYNGTT
jgi:hypothetical protein